MIEDKRRECINLGSYNYLGFAENDGPCTRQAVEATKDFGLSACSSRHELGTLEIHRKVSENKFILQKGSLSFQQTEIL